MSTSLRVLIIHRSAAVSEEVVRLLAVGGFAPAYIRVSSLDELNSRLAGYAWDLILAAADLPELDEACRAVRLGRPNTPLLLVDDSDHARGDACRGQGLSLVCECVSLDKPDDLVMAVRKLLGRSAPPLAGLDSGGFTLHRAYFEQLFENSPQAIAILNTADEVLEINRGFEEMFGFTPAEAKGRRLPELIVPQDMAEDSRDMRDKASRHGVTQRETVRMRKNGQRVDVAVLGCPIEASGVRVGVFWIYSDISARKKTEQALRQAERQYRGVFENAVMGIFQASLDLQLTMVNPALATLLGCASTDELLTRPELCELFLGDPERSVELWSLLEEHGEVSGFEVPTRRLDDQPIWLAISARLVQGAGGQRFLEGTVENVTARKLAEERLRLAEEKYRSIFVNAQEGIYQTTPDGRCLSANPALARMLGFDSPADLVGRSFEESGMAYVHSGRRDEFVALMEEHGQVAAFESQVYRRDGRIIWISEHARTVRGEDGAIQFFEGTAIEITKRKHAEEKLRQAEAKFRSIFENSLEGIFQIAPEGRFVAANPALARIYGFASPEALMEGLSGSIGCQATDPARTVEFEAALKAQGHVTDFELEIRRQEGHTVWVSLSVWEVRDEDGALLYHEGLAQDVTARRQAQDQLRHQAFHDALTGLPNRILFMDRLEWALHRARRKHGYRFAVFFLDLDRFKVVNDSLGHQAGDALLVEVASRLKKALRPMDTVARFGGDEFAVLVDDVSGALGVTHILSRLQEELSKPMTVQGRPVFTSSSIGVVLKTWTYERPEHIVRDADIAMYRAKNLGKARYEIFDPTMHLAATSLLQLETDLRLALEREELTLHYQPIVSLTTGEVTGLEALVRWSHPLRGLIPPGDFIPLAEETGLIIPLGSWVLRQACLQLARWRQGRPDAKPLTMSVNISAKQFMNLELVEEIRSVLEETGLPPECLKLEITESKVMENAEFTARMLTNLKALGVKISIDDFGTGYSSLAYLHRFPLDSLKIDRSFVGKMGDAPENAEIVGAIVNLARNLGLEVVAEGVELNDQLTELKDLDCTYGQGFLFSRPVPGEEAAGLLDKDFRHP